jgi:hypothetical protein
MGRVPSISGNFLGTKCAGLTWGRRSYPSQRLIAMFLLLEYTISGEKDSYLNERLEEDCMVIVPQHKEVPPKAITFNFGANILQSSSALFFEVW